MRFYICRDLEYDKLNKMMRDKSHVQKNREIYQRYNLVVDDYDDEYDDTYDDHDIGSEVQDDVIETDRPFTTPRVNISFHNFHKNLSFFSR